MNIMKMGKNPNYLGSWDIEENDNRELVLTIKRIVDEDVVGNEGRKERNTVAYFEEDRKPMVLNITNKKTLCKLYKTTDTEKLVGKRIKIGTETVKAFGGIYDALRIRAEIPEKGEEDYLCSDCGGHIRSYGKMSAKQMAAYTAKNYGRPLCTDCAIRAKEADTNEAD